MIERFRVGLVGSDGTAIPLRAVEMIGEVVGGTLCMKLRQRYENTEQEPLEALYTFPVPSEATLTGFVMECGERRLEATVKEREEAFDAYHDALSAGDGAALLDQERPNVFSVSVGNLLPGETTVIEVQYVQRLHANEGGLRLVLPTLVAPRYIPGIPAGDRTAHGGADPTSRVPDADRISPTIGPADYSVSLQLSLPGTAERALHSPSHRLSTVVTQQEVRVSFAEARVALDRDVVIVVEDAADSALPSLLAHKQDESGYFVLTQLCDLGAEALGAQRGFGIDAVFLLDRSGSMEGASLPEAQKALRLCLRQLREGDRFAIMAFNDENDAFRDALVPFTQRTLEEADTWIEAIEADGGTELLEPLLQALTLVGGGVERESRRHGCLVLLTDGQVGNEDEIEKRVLAQPTAAAAAIHSFAIGTNVSDTLLLRLARRTQGSVESIHPGERVDEKVVATFARAIAPRVRDLRLKWLGVEVQELAPADLPAWIDGEPWTLFGRYRHAGRGSLEIRGTLAGQAWLLQVPVELPEQATQPNLPRLWAAERVRDLERDELNEPNPERAKSRIVALATEHGIASRYTSFVVLEARTGARRTQRGAAARPVPVHAPAGWAMLERLDARTYLTGRAVPVRVGAYSAPSAPAPSLPFHAARMQAGSHEDTLDSLRAPPFESSPFSARLASLESDAPPTAASLAADASGSAPVFAADGGAGQLRPGLDRAFAVLALQLASGLWSEPGTSSDAVESQVRATADNLLALLRLGIDAAHSQHGPLIRKAVAALLPLAAALADSAPQLAERALSIAWLSTTGPRTRRSLRAAIARAGLSGLCARLDDEPALRSTLLADASGAG
jgi:Ca-activated chloride channel family protein